MGTMRGSIWLLFGAVSRAPAHHLREHRGACCCRRAAHRQQESHTAIVVGRDRSTVIAQTPHRDHGPVALPAAPSASVIAIAAAAALRFAAAELPRIDEITINGRVLAYTVVSSVLVVIPVRAAAGHPRRPRRAQAGHRDGRPHPGVGRATDCNGTLVGVAGARSPSRCSSAPGSSCGASVSSGASIAGFEPARVLSFRISGNFAETTDFTPPHAAHRQQRSRELRELPGVEAAATTVALPGLPFQVRITVQLVGARRTSADPRMVAERRIGSPEYFATMQIPLSPARCAGERRAVTRARS